MTGSWKTTLGAALGGLGAILLGIGAIPQLNGVHSDVLTYTALAGFAIGAAGTFFGLLFARDNNVSSVDAGIQSITTTSTGKPVVSPVTPKTPHSMKSHRIALMAALLLPVSLFTSCAAVEKLANSEQTASQLSVLQKKAFDLAMNWLDKWLGGSPAMAARSAVSPEDQFIAQNKAKLQAEGISEADARVGFRAAKLKH